MESGDNLQMACELIDPGGPAEPSEVTAKPKKERKDLFQINTHPGSHISANNKRDRRLKKIVMRVVEFCKKEHEEGLQIPFRFFKKRASVMTGVSLSTIHRIETIDMKEQSPEPKSKPKPKKEGEKKKKKKKTSDTSSQDEAASQPKKKRVRKKKEKTEAEVPQDAHNIMLNSTNPNAAVAGTSTNIQNNVVGTVAATADLISMQPPQHSFAVAPGSVTTVVTTININNQGAGGAGPQDGRGGCGWTAGPVGPFTMGELRDGTVPVGATHAAFTGQLDASGWPAPVGPFAGSVQGTAALVGHQVVQAYSTNPAVPNTVTHPQHGRNSPVFFQF